MADVDPDMQKAFAKAGGAPPMPEADKDHMAKLAAKKREAMAAQVRAHDSVVPSLAPARCPFWARIPPASHVRALHPPELALCCARLTLCAVRRRLLLLLRLSRGSWRKRTRRKTRSRSVLRPAKRQRIRCADICSHGPHFTAALANTAADLWRLWGGRLGRLGCPRRTALRSLRSWSCWTARSTRSRLRWRRTTLTSEGARRGWRGSAAPLCA